MSQRRISQSESEVSKSGPQPNFGLQLDYIWSLRQHMHSYNSISLLLLFYF